MPSNFVFLLVLVIKLEEGFLSDILAHEHIK